MGYAAELLKAKKQTVHRDEGHKAAIAESIRKKWADPEFRERMLQAKHKRADSGSVVNLLSATSEVACGHVRRPLHGGSITSDCKDMGISQCKQSAHR